MVAAVFCIAIEAFNTVRVLFLSNSGLSTLNNRIYFGFYVFLLAASVLYFFFVSMLGKKPDTGNAVCLVYAGIVLLWNTCLNVYDIVRSSRVHVIMAVTMMITFAAIVTARPVYTLINIWINYFIFMMVSSIPLFSGEGFNYTITALISSMISLVGYRRLCIELEQRRQIREIGQKLDERRMWLTREQYELISQNAGFITFQWEPETDRIVFSKNWTEIFEHHNVIPGFLSFVDNSTLIEQEQKRRIRCCIEKNTDRSGVSEPGAPAPGERTYPEMVQGTDRPSESVLRRSDYVRRGLYERYHRRKRENAESGKRGGGGQLYRSYE